MLFHDYALVVNKEKEGTAQLGEEILRFIREKGFPCELCDAENGRSRIPDGTDCLMVLGGDGTVLRAARDLNGRDIPILGINLGTLGYLTEIERDKWESGLTQVLSGNFGIEERMMLKGFDAAGGVHYALNDAVIARTGTPHMVTYNVYIGGQFLNAFRADGMIISTPTGSTAYNLSAGGPIVSPEANIILMTPICPHTLGTRSIVLSAEEEIEVEVSKDESASRDSIEAEASFDGNPGVRMCAGDRIGIRKAGRRALLVRLSRTSFLEVLHRKMN